MNTNPTTDRAQRLSETRRGERDTAIDRRNPGGNPEGAGANTPSRVRQQELRREIATEADVAPRGVGTIDRLGGVDAFLRQRGTEQFGQQVRSEFASDAEFVSAADVDANVDSDAIAASPVVAEARRDDVGARAREQTAAEDRFARPEDFDVAVGARGVTELGLTDRGARRRAGRQFEAETALGNVDPTADLEATESGFMLDDGAQRRSAARRFEDDLAAFDSGALDPSSDLRTVGDGFGLAEGPARQAAAADIDSRLGGIDVTPGDLTASQTDSGRFEFSFQREVQR